MIAAGLWSLVSGKQTGGATTITEAGQLASRRPRDFVL
jgi:hypothetical protein